VPVIWPRSAFDQDVHRHGHLDGSDPPHRGISSDTPALFQVPIPRIAGVFPHKAWDLHREGQEFASGWQIPALWETLGRLGPQRQGIGLARKARPIVVFVKAGDGKVRNIRIYNAFRTNRENASRWLPKAENPKTVCEIIAIPGRPGVKFTGRLR
jgi:hypothetical protein